MSNGTEFISQNRLNKQTARRIKALKRLYSGLCENGAAGEVQSFFADNFHTVISAAQTGRGGSEMLWYPGRFPLADGIIAASGDRFPSTDELIMVLRRYVGARKIYGSELECLRYCLVYTLIERIYELSKTWDSGLIRMISLLSDMPAIDAVEINDVLNPIAIRLSEDPAYRKSDAKTRLFYRKAIYATAYRFKLDELKLCNELFEKYAPEPIDISSLTVLKKRHRSEKSAVLAAVLLIIGAAALSLGIAFSAGAPLAALLLFLPATEAIRPVSDCFLSKGRTVSRLLRLDPAGREVLSTPAAIVLSAAVSGPEEALLLYDKLKRLRCLNPQENILICALVDLPAEQVPITSEDKPVIESLGEIIERLNLCGGSYSCIVRKRTFSETQQEYMGKERKRGALYDLCRFIKTGEGDFYAALGETEKLRGIDYICAVDSDTLPAMDSVSELLAAALHPANKVVVKNGIVTRGYGIIAPRMVIRLKDSLRSEFSKSMGGTGSRSSYDEEAGSLYQEVFGRGTFCGKGLINVTALFECTESLSGERVLSHDILEGELLKTAYVGDVCFTEGFPKSPQSYYRRLDRWIRGDFQNLPEVFSRRFSPLSKLKLLDNLRRAAIPPVVLTAFLLSFLYEPVTSAIIAVSALLLWLLPIIFGTLGALLRDGRSGRHFYSGLLSSFSQGIRFILYSVVTLPVLAVKSARAILTASARLLTRRNLLEWTTADASDRASRNPLVFYLLPELLSLLLLWSPDYAVRLFGAIFSSFPALLSIGNTETTGEPSLQYGDIRELSKQTADMWGFYDSFVTAVDNYLPPDNVQFSPVYRIAHRTSPTNIGLYMLSVLAAYDRKIISAKALVQRLSKTLSTVERLEKYCGNLYNWYDTKTLDICPNPYVSSVDSGNFICCMVALRQGLEELENTEGLQKRIEKIIGDCKLSAFYDPVRGLMSIGIDPKNGQRSPSHYDYLMSEARLTSFWAIASRQVPKSHWQRLSRAMLSSGFRCGAASYSGTMFEYFMPELLLKSPVGSLFNESLRYALAVQKKYARSLDRPYGISESGYYSFDNALNYRYMAHGVPNTGVRRGLSENFVLSPYSVYISLCISGSDGVDNLRKIADYGMYGTYGLYEALDFTPPDSDKPEPVRSYMAHHIGMSIIACDNVLSAGIMQKRFMSDPRVMGALELTDERFHLGRLVFENNLRRPEISAPEPRLQETEGFEAFSLISPRVKLLSNGEMTLMIADNGDSTAIYRSKNVYCRTRDLFSRPKGAFSFFYDGDKALPFCYLPDLQEKAALQAEFSEDHAAFYRSTKKLSAGMKIRLHEKYPCELRTFALKNETSETLSAAVFSYIEPSLSDNAAESAHPAYSKLFLRCERDLRWQISVITRVREEQKIYLAVGFIEEVSETVSFDRGEVGGLDGLCRRFSEISPSLICEPDPCIFTRVGINLPPRSEAELTMFLVCADSKSELINRVAEIRRKRLCSCAQPRLDTAYGRIAARLLPSLLYDAPSHSPAKIPENLPLRALWELSVSIDLPIVFVALNDRGDAEKLSAYLGAYRLLRRCGVELQLIFAFDDGGRYERSHYTELIAAARKMGLESSVYSSGGILPLDLGKVRRELYDLAAAAACHVCIDEIAAVSPAPPSVEYREIISSLPIEQPVSLPVALGGFSGESYVINGRPPLPWCHVLSNPVFGTLLSNGSLGFTYAFNSRENRLTPWDNDPQRDNIGERLLLKADGKIYDLIRGSSAVFSPYKAEYFSKNEKYKSKITVSVSEKGMCKRISVEISLRGEGELCYYTEPCLGVDRSHTRLITPKRFERGLILSSSASEVDGYMCLSASEVCTASTDRHGILSGSWVEDVSPGSGLIAAVFCRISGKKQVDFFMSYGLTESSAKAMPELFFEQTDTRQRSEKIYTGDVGRDLLCNVWLRYQALHGRIYARTGFWQCSGAYGFRDQLQDAVCIAEENPSILKTQILRCCRAQFPQGDVMHWWHSLPNKKWRGIRTRISDDCLWLPYSLCEYIKNTGDRGILALEVAYSDGISLSENENERYGEVYKTAHRESVYLHCRRAIDFRAGKTGEHGLMLIGTGDWNDGFNNVGKDGKGESVWLSEFYIIVLRRFSKIAEYMGDSIYSATLIDYADALAEAVEEYGRGKQWYLRGYFDNGAPLGSSTNPECRLDSIAQSFAQFADLGGDGFTQTALKNAVYELCDFKRGIVRLFTPPFSDDSEPDPGYVRCYPEGVRENGGQYTHAAVWLGLACLRAGLTREGMQILDALSPVRHSENGGFERYKAEPYYLCGDVYSNPNCCGRGGWSIYTGSAGWYYRALREAFSNGAARS